MNSKAKIAVKWLDRIVSAILLILLLSVIFFLFSSKLRGGKPQIFGKQIMTVLSGSMEPGIKTGSIIVVKPINDAKDLKEGQVITYKSLDDPNSFITHRIVKVNKSGNNVTYITKGDNNNTEDPKPIPASNVVGLYANITIPLLGYIFSFIKSKTGIILVLIVPGALLIISQLISMFKLIMSLEERVKVSEQTPSSDQSE